MKKILSLALAMVMALSLSVTVFAETHQTEGTYAPTTDTANIQATYDQKSDAVVNKYHVTVSWQSSGSITYSNAYTTYTWNPTGENLKYDSATTDAKWTCNSAQIEITVENKSDNAVEAVCGTPVAQGSVTAIDGNYDETSHGTIALESAATGITAENNYQGNGEAKSGTATYTINSVTGSIDQNGTIGTITITVSAK